MRVRLASSVTSALAAVALTATMLASAVGPASAADPSPPAAAATTPAAGWFLTLVSRGDRTAYGIDARKQTLELVSPTGTRRVLYTGTIGKRGAGYTSLVDWTADGGTALVTTAAPSPTRQRAIAVDTVSGAVRALDVPKGYFANLLSPDGNGVIVTRYQRKGVSLARLGWDGSLASIGSASGRLIATSSTTVMGQTSKRRTEALDVLSLTTGGIVNRFPTPGLYCDAVRAWDATHVELSCASGSQQQLLRLVDTTTGVMVPLTAPHPKSKKLTGDVDARALDGSLYVQVVASCGLQIARALPDGTLSKVKVASPGANVTLVGTTGSDLVVQRFAGCNGAVVPSALSRVNPVTGVEQPIVVLPGKELFDRVMPFGDTASSLY